MEEVLKETFENYYVYDYSNKNNNAIPTILRLCANNKNIIVYIKRHSENEEYFKTLEEIDKHNQFYDPRPILELVINSDNYVGFREDMSIDKKIRNIRKNLLDDDACAICMEKKTELRQFFICKSCTNSVCMECLIEDIKNQIMVGKATKEQNSNKISFICASCRQPNHIKLI